MKLTKSEKSDLSLAETFGQSTYEAVKFLIDERQKEKYMLRRFEFSRAKEEILAMATEWRAVREAQIKTLDAFASAAATGSKTRSRVAWEKVLKSIPSDHTDSMRNLYL
jgi:hypothetical protein